MKERIVENWLIKATERSFQLTFCHILSSKGYKVIHLSRHCGMELGKDVLAIDPEGTYWAYQLKSAPTGKIKLKYWQDELVGQLNQLVYTPPIHPQIPRNAQHKAVFVTNGELEEEVAAAIDSTNLGWEAKGAGHLKIHTYLKGDFIKDLIEMKSDFLPSELEDFHTFLAFFIDDGSRQLDCGKFYHLLSSVIKDEKFEIKKDLMRAISSGAILTTLALQNYSNQGNHFSEVRGWVIYLAKIFRHIEKGALLIKDCKVEIEIAEQTIVTAIQNLIIETKESFLPIVGNPLLDTFVFPARSTLLVGLFSFLGLYYKFKGVEKEKEEDVKFIAAFSNDPKYKRDLWGEGAIPQYMSFMWFLKIYQGKLEWKALLEELLKNLCQRQINPLTPPLPEPYFDYEEVFEKLNAIQEEKQNNNIFPRGASYCLEGLVLLLVRMDDRQFLNAFWPHISRVHFKAFKLADVSDFFQWRSENGIEKSEEPKLTESWKKLVEKASNIVGEGIPNVFREMPYFYPLFLMVFPHRWTSSGVVWFDKVMQEME